LKFLPARTEVSIAAATEREISVRVFSEEAMSGLREAMIRVSGAADFEQRFQAVPIGRGETIAYARDLDGDGVDDCVLESQRVRASFSGVDGRWMEWVWRDSNTNLLPDPGLLPGRGPMTARPTGAGWEFRQEKGRRTVSLGADNRLTIEQDQPLPPETLKAGKKDGVSYSVDRPAPNRAVYSLERAQ
jgi:hypothetical protein